MKFRVITEEEVSHLIGNNHVTTHLYDEGSDGLHAWTAIKPDQPTPISMLGTIAFLDRMAVLESTPMSQR